MNQEKLTYFRKKLEADAESLLSEADKTLSEMTDQNENYPDPTDRASAESDRNFELRLRDRERKLLVKIKSAISRIDDESYGICEDCGDDISAERLEARPVTTLCIACKTKQENHEKTHAG
nr:RNA polymerase-binding protein DksA [Desulfobulbaceae bacterium]